MSLLQKGVVYHRRNPLIVAVGLLLTASTFTAGCAKQADTAAASAPVSQKGNAPTVPTTDVKGTPEQEAAKARAIKEGPAIEAALKAQQEGK